MCAAQLLPLPNFHILEPARLFFSPINSSYDKCSVESEHYPCKMISGVIAEFSALTFPKQDVNTDSAACPEFDNISLKSCFCGYKFQFSSLFPVKTSSLVKRVGHQKGQFYSTVALIMTTRITQSLLYDFSLIDFTHIHSITILIPE